MPENLKRGLYKALSILLVVCLSMSIAPISALAEGTDAVCKIDDDEYASLDLALDAIGEEESKTIELLTDIDYDKGMVIENRSVIFALGEYDLTIDNEEGIGIQVTEGTVEYTGEGEFNVTGTTVGAYTEDPSTITVTNAVGTTGYGVNASAGKITVNGYVVGATVGAQAVNGGEVTIVGDVRALNEGGTGALAVGYYSTIIIGGSIYASKYIQIGETVKDKTAGTVDDEKRGYLKYGSESEGTVWVQNTACAIGEEGYVTLDEALANVPKNKDEPTIITLLKNINHEQSIILDSQKITFELNGFILNVHSEDEDHPALEVNNGERVLLDGDGELNVRGKHCGVSVSSTTPSAVTVTSAEATATGGIAAYAQGNASITVWDDVYSFQNGGYGAIACNTAYIHIKGEVIATGTGVEADAATIYVEGGISAGQLGAKALDDGTVTIDGEINAPSYIMVDGITKNKGSGVPDAEPGYLLYSGSGTDSAVRVKATATVFEVATPNELINSLNSALSGDTIRLTDDIIYTDNTSAASAAIKIQGKNITLDMNGYNLTIGNTGQGRGLWLEKPVTNDRNATQLHVIGSGTLKISSTTVGLSVNASKFISSSTVNVEILGTFTAGIGGILADVDIQNGSVTGSDGITLSYNSNVTVKGPVKANVNVGVNLSNSKLDPEDRGCTVYVDSIVANGHGISMDGGEVTVDGTITAPAYIQFKDAGPTTIGIGDCLPETTQPGYRTYQHETAGTVWVKAISSADITSSFTDSKFLAAVRSKLGKDSGDPIYTADVARITDLGIVGKGIASLAGIEYFTALITLDCSDNALKTLDVSSLPKLTELYCSYNLLTRLVLNGSADYSQIDARNNYMENESAVTGKNIIWDNYRFKFSPQKALQATYPLTVQSGTGSGSYAENTIVTIIATAAPGGQCFKEWVVSPAVAFEGGTKKTYATASICMPAQAVTATATYEALPALHYAITVQSDGNGTASANTNSAAENTEIILTATPNSNYRFKEWQVVSGDVTIATNKFTMPSRDVTVKAIFEPVAVATHPLTVNGSYAGTSGAGQYAPGTPVTIHAGSRSNYSFAGWTTSDGVTFANAGSATTTFTMPAKNITVTANWRYNGGSGGSEDGSAPSVAPPAASEWLEQNETSAPIAEAKKKSRIHALTRASGQYGVRAAAWAAFGGYQYWHDTMDADAVQVRVYVKNPTAITTDLLVSGYVKGAEAQAAKSLFEKYFSNKVRTIHLDQAEAWGQSVEVAAKVDLTGMDVTKLVLYSYDKATNTYRRIEKPTYWVDVNGYLHFTAPYAGDIVISEGLLALTAGLSFTAFAAETEDSAPQGASEGAAWQNPFGDVRETDWYYHNVKYAYVNKLFSGTSDTTFAPNTPMTRGMLVTVLGRMSGADVSGYVSSFGDVADDAYYAKYTEWVRKNGIVSGVGGNSFAPDAIITRQDMAVMLARYAAAMGLEAPDMNAGTAFADAGKISDYAKDAALAMQKAGIISGKPGGVFDPNAGATRAEVSAMLHRFSLLFSNVEDAVEGVQP